MGKIDIASEYREFVRLVKEMRTAQKNYFRTRLGSWLTESRRLEREVDHKLEAPFREPAPASGALFNEEREAKRKEADEYQDSFALRNDHSANPWRRR